MFVFVQGFVFLFTLHAFGMFLSACYITSGLDSPWYTDWWWLSVSLACGASYDIPGFIFCCFETIFHPRQLSILTYRTFGFPQLSEFWGEFLLGMFFNDTLPCFTIFGCTKPLICVIISSAISFKEDARAIHWVACQFFFLCTTSSLSSPSPCVFLSSRSSHCGLVLACPLVNSLQCSRLTSFAAGSLPRFPREGTRGEGNKAAALEAIWSIA